MGAFDHLNSKTASHTPKNIPKMLRFICGLLLVASAMANEQKYQQYQQAQAMDPMMARQGLGSSSSSDLLLVPRQASSLSKCYVQGLATTFMLVFGLVSILDMIFSRISLTQALSFALDHDIRRRRQQRDLNDLEELILRC